VFSLVDGDSLEVRLSGSSLLAWVDFRLLVLFAGGAAAQDLEPRAYSESPVGTNFVVVPYSHTAGGVLTDPTLPVDDVSASLNGVAVGYFRAMNVLGRSANFTVVAPYAWGTVEGNVLEQMQAIRRSGQPDGRIRFAINLKGAPAMNLREFLQYRRKTNLGSSIVVIPPTGQYDPNRFVNLGTNRWTFKPELGFSRAIGEAGRLTLDLYGGVWLFTANKEHRTGPREQAPMLTTQFHLNYRLRPRMWVSFDATFYRGGQTTTDGQTQLNEQRNTRFGGTMVFPITVEHSVKLALSRGAWVRAGSNFTSIAVAYQYLWNRRE
jgi:hypothetical protein